MSTHKVHYLFNEFITNLLPFSRIQFKFTIYIAYSLALPILFLRIYFQFTRKFTIVLKNSLLIPYLRKLTSNSLFFENLLSIQYLYREFTWNPNLFCEFTLNSQSSSRINFKFIICFANQNGIPLFCEFTSNSLSISRIQLEFSIFFANSPWIYKLIRESTLNSLSFSRIHFAFTIIFAYSLSIYYLYREFTCSSLFHFCEFTLNSLCIFWTHYKLTIVFKNSFSSRFFSREFTTNSLSCSRIHFQFIILIKYSLLYFANSLRIHFSSREFN